MKRRKKRCNPSMLILHNPSRGRRTRRPDLDDAYGAWSEFHDADQGQANVIEVPDVPGLPGTVMSLGVCEGYELVEEASLSAKAMVVSFRRSASSTERGPWLVTDEDMKTLWVVCRRSDASKLRRADGAIMRAIYYWPPENSGKHDPQRAFRHEFGETGEGGRPRREWPRYYPECELVAPNALEIVRLPGQYTINQRGIVG